LVGLSAVIIGACGSSGSAQGTTGKKLVPLTVVTSGPQPIFMAAYLAEITGAAEREGLNLSVKVGGTNLATVMASGGADVALSSPVAAVAPAKEGLQTSIIFDNEPASGVAFVVGTENIKTIQQCSRMAAGTVGQTGYGSSVLLKQELHLRYSILQFGTGPAQDAALVSNRADCGIGVYDLWAAGIAAGHYHLIVDPRQNGSLPTSFPAGATGQVFWGVTSRLKVKRAAVVKLLRAVNDVYVHVIDAEPAAKIAAQLLTNSVFQGQPKAAVAASIANIEHFLPPYRGYVPSTQWPSTLNFLRQSGLGFIEPGNPTWSYAERVDMTYYKLALGRNGP
jgi:hypothetical protein